jgi:hypothetical protein
LVESCGSFYKEKPPVLYFKTGGEFFLEIGQFFLCFWNDIDTATAAIKLDNSINFCKNCEIITSPYAFSGVKF